MNRRTLRGRVDTNDQTRRLIVDDGRVNHGFKIVAFHIISNNPATSAADAFGSLATEETAATAVWNLDDNRQIGWAGQNLAGTAAPSNQFSLIDPDHVVINDLFVCGRGGTGATADGYQYLVELEPIELTDNQAVIQLIKESAQDA